MHTLDSGHCGLCGVRSCRNRAPAKRQSTTRLPPCMVPQHDSSACHRRMLSPHLPPFPYPAPYPVGPHTPPPRRHHLAGSIPQVHSSPPPHTPRTAHTCSVSHNRSHKHLDQHATHQRTNPRSARIRTNAPTHRRTDAPTHRRTDAPTHRHTQHGRGERGSGRATRARSGRPRRTPLSHAPHPLCDDCLAFRRPHADEPPTEPNAALAPHTPRP